MHAGYSGNDTLIGGRGDDTLSGNDGSDTYVFNPGDGQDTIEDNGLFAINTPDTQGIKPHGRSPISFISVSAMNCARLKSPISSFMGAMR